MPPSNSIIRVSNLTKTFKVIKRKPGFWGGLKTLFSSDYQEFCAVNNISFEVEQGELVGYLGPNGAGKSTTIKMLTGILYPTSGEVMIDGLVPYQNRIQNSQKIGVLFGQRSQLLWDLPPRDSFELMHKMYATPKAQYQSNLALFTDMLDLTNLMDRPVRQLSLGQRMRCEIVASLLHNPKIIYLDEPTIGLDIVAKERIREFIQYLNQHHKTTVLLTTHDLSDIEKLCNRVVIIDKGQVIYDGSLATIRQQYGQHRRIMFSVQHPIELKQVKETMQRFGDKPTIEVANRNSVSVTFDPSIVAASEITKDIVNYYDVQDFTVTEPDLENIIHEIYSQGRVIAQ